jgi:plasmid stabilization system protein ParE
VIRAIVFLPEAEDEVAAALEWYEPRRPGIGADFLAELDLAVRTIAEHPEAWPVWRERHPFRKRAMERFPFVVFFRIAATEIRIIAVAHARRRPGYWIDRR